MAMNTNLLDALKEIVSRHGGVVVWGLCSATWERSATLMFQATDINLQEEQ
ncbi:MAG: hypothetical protein LBT00_00865 [Spirochaetaceae bacterium]|jgi:hypothetical protein|nr:hypothetical protein [Spirochaetaceae bacterium]